MRNNVNIKMGNNLNKMRNNVNIKMGNNVNDKMRNNLNIIR